MFIFPILLFSLLTACVAYQVNRDEKRRIETAEGEIVPTPNASTPNAPMPNALIPNASTNTHE
jgi:hypothetical protein